MEPREQQVRTWSMLCHLAALSTLIFSLGLVLGPLLVWQIKKNELPEIDAHGKEAVNFQLTIVLINIILWIIIGGFTSFYWMVRSPFMFGYWGFGIIIGIVNIAALVLAVIAGLRANSGGFYRYPFAIRFIK